MPYNNNPIEPTGEVTGTVNLPLARTKKILNADDTLPTVSNNAAFAITVATEQFLQYLVEQTHNVVKAERKPRRNIQYRDVAGAVARHDNLEFLTDVVPRTVPGRAVRERLAKGPEVAPGQGRIDGRPNGGAAEEEGETVMQSPTRERSDHAGPEVMDIDAVTSPVVERPEGGHIVPG